MWESDSFDLENSDTLTTFQWLREGHYEESMLYLINKIKSQDKRIKVLEKILITKMSEEYVLR